MMEWMTTSDIEHLKCFAQEVSERNVSAPTKLSRHQLEALENFGRERLSRNFFMRDFMYSEISATYGIPNIPNDPELALKAGRGLCQKLLEPLLDRFGHISVRSAFRSKVINGFGSNHGNMNCSANKRNFSKHIWDVTDGGDIGATACIIIPWFIDSKRYQESRDWRPLALFIHDTLPYSEMRFFSKNAAFNLSWRMNNPKRKIYGLSDLKEEDHSEAYSWFPGL